jgi:hypothetical protein
VPFPGLPFDREADIADWAVRASQPAGLEKDTLIQWRSHGDVAAGSLWVQLPFVTENAQRWAYVALLRTTPFCMRSLKLRGSVFYEAGFAVFPAEPGTAQFELRTASGAFVRGPKRAIDTQGTWHTVTLDLGAPAETSGNFDADQVTQIGMRFETPSVGRSVDTGLYLDTFVATP